MQSDHENPANYGVTMKSRKIVTRTRASQAFQEDDSSAIYNMLRENLKPVDFSYYLKRYVFEKAGYTGSAESVPVQDYADTICQAFTAGGVPPSFKPTGTRLRAAVQNWLTRKTVSRESVLMLGFGLDMSLEEVNGFLTKALQESALNPKDPVETICWYCFGNHLGYYHFRDLLSAYEELPGSDAGGEEISHAGTTRLRTEVEDIRDEKTLKRYLNRLRRIDGRSRQSVEARAAFDRLYAEARAMIAETGNRVEEGKKEIEAARLRERLSNNDRLYDEQKQERIRQFTEQRKQWTPKEITPVHFEEILFSAVPRDRNGNLVPMKGSDLNEQFRGKRLNRQHIQEILDGTGTITRYDLATMSFFVFSQRKETEDDPIGRYRAFMDNTNGILDRCGMGELYIANPYEAFLMMCMLTDYPIGTYADVWELSYETYGQ